MTTVWKYSLSVSGCEIVVPVGYYPLCVKLQDGAPMLWCVVLSTMPKVKVVVKIFGAGEEIPDGLRYIDTYLQGPYVWHVFAKDWA